MGTLIERKDCPMRHENGNCTVAGGFCTAVNDPICEALHNAYDCGKRSVDIKDLVPQGEWIETTYKSFIPTEQPENGFVVTHSHVGYRCNRCGRVEEKKEPFCHCGARMKGAD